MNLDSFTLTARGGLAAFILALGLPSVSTAVPVGGPPDVSVSRRTGSGPVGVAVKNETGPGQTISQKTRGRTSSGSSVAGVGCAVVKKRK